MSLAESRVTLRPARPDDSEFLFHVYASTRLEELAPVPWTTEQRETFLRQQFQAQDMEYRRNYEDASFEIIEVDDQPAGRMYLDRRTHEIRIIDIALLPEYRAQGIGSSLLCSLLDEAHAVQKRVSIHVEIHNPARRLYERLGFSPVAEHGVYVLMEARP